MDAAAVCGPGLPRLEDESSSRLYPRNPVESLPNDLSNGTPHEGMITATCRKEGYLADRKVLERSEDPQRILVVSCILWWMFSIFLTKKSGTHAVKDIEQLLLVIVEFE